MDLLLKTRGDFPSLISLCLINVSKCVNGNNCQPVLNYLSNNMIQYDLIPFPIDHILFQYLEAARKYDPALYAVRKNFHPIVLNTLLYIFDVHRNEDHLIRAAFCSGRYNLIPILIKRGANAKICQNLIHGEYVNPIFIPSINLMKRFGISLDHGKSKFKENCTTNMECY